MFEVNGKIEKRTERDCTTRKMADFSRKTLANWAGRKGKGGFNDTKQADGENARAAFVKKKKNRIGSPNQRS